MILSRRDASFRPERARRSRDHVGTVSVLSKLPPLYVPVSPSHGSRDVSRELWHSIDPSTLVVFKLRTSLSCVRQYNVRLSAHVRAKTNVIVSRSQTTLDSIGGWFWPAREEEDNKASHKRRQTTWNLAREGKVVKSGDRLCGGVGGWDRDRKGWRTIRWTFAPLSSSPTSR